MKTLVSLTFIVYFCFYSSAGWINFQLPADEEPNGTATDMSFILDAPAGKHGQVEADGENLKFNDGTLARFFGIQVNIPVSKSMALQMAKRFARNGINLVQIHDLRTSITTDMVSRNSSIDDVDILDSFVYELKIRGIYVAFHALAPMLTAHNNVPEYPYTSTGYKDPFYLFNTQVQNVHMAWAQNLLNHENPYTNVSYKDEAGLVFIQLVNESSPFNAESLALMGAEYKAEAQSQYNAWCTFNGYSTENFKRWDDPAVSDNQVDFVIEKMQNYFSMMKNTIRGTGCQALISFINKAYGLPSVKVSAMGDITDVHGYFDHPQRDFGSRFIGYRALDFPNLLPLSLSPVPIAQHVKHAQKSKPCIVSEFDWHMYNAYEILMQPAYSSYQGFAGITVHNFDWGFDPLVSYYRPTPSMDFRSGNSTVKMILLRISALMFIRGDISLGKESDEVIVKWGSDEIYDHLTTDARTFYKSDFPYNMLLERKVRVKLDESQVSFLNPAPYTPEGPYQSDKGLDTEGEIEWDTDESGNGYLKIDPRSGRVNAVIGDLGSFSEDDLCTSYLTINSDIGSYGTIALISLDGKDIGASSRMLFAAVSSDRNTGMSFMDYPGDDLYMIVDDYGTEPLLCEEPAVSVDIRNLNVSLSGSKIIVYPLDTDGERIAGQKFSVSGSSKITIDTDNYDSLWYEIEVLSLRLHALAQDIQTLDGSGCGNIGIYKGNASITDGVVHPVLKAIQLGYGDYVEIADDASLDSVATSGQISISAWIHPDTIKWAPIISRFKDLSWGQFELRTRGGTSPDIMFQLNGLSKLISAPLDYVDKWTHVVATYDGTAMRLYFNGILQNEISYSSSIQPSDDPVNIGRGKGSAYFDGKIEDARIYNYALSLSEIQELNALKNSTIKLMGHWKLEETGSTYVDSSTEGNNGTKQGDPVPAIGVSGNALKFDGNGDYVSINPSSTWDNAFTSGITLSAWAKSYDVHWKGIFAKSSSTSWGTFDLRTRGESGDFLFAAVINGSEQTLDSPPIDYTYKWKHITATYDNTEMKLYINGELVNQKNITGTLTADTNNVTIGVDRDSNFGFNGKIDDVRIYNGALGKGEIKTLYFMNKMNANE